jgi:hypothetical protein
MVSQRERNAALIDLLIALKKDGNADAIESLRILVEGDTDSIKKTFDVVLNDTSFCNLFFNTEVPKELTDNSKDEIIDLYAMRLAMNNYKDRSEELIRLMLKELKYETK